MRYTDRTKIPAPASLTGPDSPGAKELKLAKKSYTENLEAEIKINFKAYKADDVKQALETLFYGKCAYCESNYRGTQPFDVEHYRPKGGIVENSMHTGYWWLAVEWDNLLPSCIDCNRQRKQIIINEFTSKEELSALASSTNGVVAGKGNSFPTLDNIWANFGEDHDIKEKPLLINPTKDNPDNYLYWPKSQISVIAPKEGENGEKCLKGIASIKAYSLNRLGLVQSRLSEKQKFLYDISRVRNLAIELMTNPNEGSAFLMKTLEEEITRLRKIIESPETQFLAMKKACLDEFESELESLLTSNSQDI